MELIESEEVVDGSGLQAHPPISFFVLNGLRIGCSRL
jgi:hypothetical protein